MHRSRLARLVLLTLAFSLLGLGPAWAPAHASPEFPQSARLAPQIAFWKRIYTEVDTKGGLIHDSREMDVVYETLRFPAGLSQRGRDRKTKARKSHYAAILKTLAKGKRSGLSVEQSRVLALFPAGVSNKALQNASRRVRFQLGQADKFRAGLVRMGRWEPYILGVLRERGLPEGLVALPHVESSYNPDAHSHVGASGLWQFTRSTGRQYMRVDHVVDERRDPFLASVAAARLLKANHERLKTWPLALTAYNHGAAGMGRAVRKLGTRDMGVIVEKYKSRTFGFASRNFYTEFVAAYEINLNPERYFGPIRKEAPERPEIVALDHYYRAQTLADSLQLPLARLRDANRALLGPVWTGQKHVPRGYGLRVPRDAAKPPARTMIAAVPAAERFGEQRADRYYRVQRGDSLSKIARRFGVRESELVALNGLRSRHRIRAGQRLRLPVKSGPAARAAVSQSAPAPVPADGLYRVQRGDTLAGIARRFGLSSRDLADANGIRNANRISVGQVLQLPGGSRTARAHAQSGGVYVVRRGDTLESIARRFDTSIGKLAAHNGLANKHRIQVGQRLYLPGEPSASRATSPPKVVEARPEAPPPTEPVVMPPPGKLAPVEAAPPVRASLEATRPRELPLASERYRVGLDGTVWMQPGESLNLLGRWLGLDAAALRRVNPNLSGRPEVGQRVTLDFARSSRNSFERQRIAHHRRLQEAFYADYAVGEARVVTLGAGDTLWELSRREGRVPLWLILAYNPDLEPHRLRAGQQLRIPSVERRS